MFQLQEDKENSKKNNEEEDNGWDVGENTYEAGEQLGDEGCLGCAGGCFFSGFISCDDTTIFFSDIERTGEPVLYQIYRPRCYDIGRIFILSATF